MEEKHIKVEMSYKFDQFLMHLIQETTKRPTAEIVAFFYELANQVAQIGVQNKMKEKSGGRRGIVKKIVDYFPDTSIPFLMKVKGYKSRGGKWVNGQWKPHDDDTFHCSSEIGFPAGNKYISEEQLRTISEALMERALLDAPLDGIQIPEFTKPEIKSSKMYIDLMNAFAGRPQAEKKRKSRKKKDDGRAATTT